MSTLDATNAVITTIETAIEDNTATPARRPHRAYKAPDEIAQGRNLRHTAIRHLRPMVSERLCEALTDNIAHHCRAVRSARRRGIVRSKIIEQAHDALLAVVKAASAEMLAETCLATELYRKAAPNTFASEKTYRIQLIRLVMHDDPKSRYSSGKRIKDKLKVPPKKVSVELAAILLRLIKAAQDTITPPAKAPKVSLLDQIIEREARGIYHHD